MKSKTLIRNIYVYLATFVGLMMIVIPAVDIFKITLENVFFPLASQGEYDYRKTPPEPYILQRVEKENLQNNACLDEQEKEALKNWQADYEKWQNEDKDKDWAAIEMQRDMARDFSTLSVGLILFLTHGYVLKKDKKKNT